MMRWAATPDLYSRTPSRTRSRCSGEGVPSGLAGIAEDDEGVEVGCGGVVRGEGEVGAVEDEGAGEEDDREVKRVRVRSFTEQGIRRGLAG